jgi:hypothetical protein
MGRTFKIMCKKYIQDIRIKESPFKICTTFTGNGPSIRPHSWKEGTVHEQPEAYCVYKTYQQACTHDKVIASLDNKNPKTWLK